jgi:uncharacterized protein
MKVSRWTIQAPIPGRDTTLFIQPLSGEALVLDATEAAALQNTPLARLPAGLDEEVLRQARVLVESDVEDERMLAEAKTAFASEMALTPTQLIAVPSFGCNLACTYCYQELFDSTRGLVEPAVIDALFTWIDRFHAGDNPRPYITLFGGEPLVDTAAHRDRVARYLDGARARGLTVAVVTNGYDLESFVEMLARGPIREVQVTLDGPSQVHDARRPHAGGGATFARIVAGMDAAVAAEIPLNLRVVVDRANLPALPDLARFANARGWLDLPSTRFKTQVGRNYELFGCAAGQRRTDLFERAELWAAYVELAEREPALRKFYRPRFHGMSHLAETGELPAPNFDGCPATKKEWAFGPDGTLYGCTATVGNPRYKLGTFYPTIERDERAIAGWSGRSTLHMDECAQCNLAPMCGGGCGAIAAARTGSPDKPDCRPVKELLGLGARFYGMDSTEASATEPRVPLSTEESILHQIAPPTATAHLHQVVTTSSARRGCLACGSDLVYLLKAQPMVCSGCGATHASRARCEQGHFFCDSCHAGTAVDAIERTCLASDETDPLAMALVAMRHPKVKMHGPEHHFLAPAVLIAAWCNLRGEGGQKAALLAEVRRRSEPVLGGFCGFQGTCGAGVGNGIFFSMVTAGSPLTGKQRGLANRATAEALSIIGNTNAPRCCKRDTFLALLSAARFARKHLDINFPIKSVRCEFREMNDECTEVECPFYARRAADAAME